ncbi:hypothetical protein ACFLIM_25345 [Nonomuraea sp. M3C6]|uniref:Multicopper oxidase n=1 Tax=Nonomuraea marmarensis TaxID=3351344 RepID=A0ABW7AK76_9ACTN
MIPPMPEEVGPKDIVIANTEMVSRIVLHLDPPRRVRGVPGTRLHFPAEYVQHCHMVEHEDNEMMRPWRIIS